MPLGSEQFAFAMRVVTVVVPVAIYFLILGLFNSRRHPALLSGRVDFALLVMALSPLFVLPALMALGLTLWTAGIAVLATGLVIHLMSPAHQTWVIYNLSGPQARQAVARSLQSLGLAFEEKPYGFVIGSTANGSAVLRLSQFPLLRNVTLRLEGGQPAQARDFEQAMARTLSKAESETSPMAVALLLVATGMLVAPLSMFVQHVPTLVRLVADLIR